MSDDSDLLAAPVEVTLKAVVVLGRSKVSLWVTGITVRLDGAENKPTVLEQPPLDD